MLCHSMRRAAAGAGVGVYEYPRSGLVAEWLFLGNALDASGGGNNLTISGPSSITDRYGNADSAYLLNPGESDYFYIADNSSLSITGPVTIGGWIYIDDKVTDQFLCKKASGGYTSEFGLRIQGSSLSFYRGNNVNVEDSLSYGISGLSLGWHFIIATDDASRRADIYVDGVSVASTTFSVTVADSNAQFNLGRYQTDGKYFDGKIDDFLIYNVAKSSTEVLAMYNGSKP